MGQGIARDLAANAEMVKLALLRAQASFDIAQTLAIGELREGHTKELIPARKTLEFVVALVAFDTTSKSLGRKKVHQLCKDRFARIHQPSATAKVAHAAAGLVLISNRSLCASGLTFSLSITYGQWANKRWDSTDEKCEMKNDSNLHLQHPFLRSHPVSLQLLRHGKALSCAHVELPAVPTTFNNVAAKHTISQRRSPMRTEVFG